MLFCGIDLSIFLYCRAVVILLLAEHHVKRILKEPIIMHSYEFPNVVDGQNLSCIPKAFSMQDALGTHEKIHFLWCY